MATKGTRKVNNIQRRPGAPPGLLAFAPPKEQEAFDVYLQVQFKYWKKERDRLAYRIRRSITSSLKKKKELIRGVQSSNSNNLPITRSSHKHPIDPSTSPDQPLSQSDNSPCTNISPILKTSFQPDIWPPVRKSFTVYNATLPPTPRFRPEKLLPICKLYV